MARWAVVQVFCSYTDNLAVINQNCAETVKNTVYKALSPKKIHFY